MWLGLHSFTCEFKSLDVEAEKSEDVGREDAARDAKHEDDDALPSPRFALVVFVADT